jgi:corrinoid protein of di/trimethylamine methyltransferase
MGERILGELRDAVLDFDDDGAKRLSAEAVAAGMDPVMVLEEGLSKALREVGDNFGRGEAFVTELIAAAQTMEAGAEILNQEIARLGASRKAVGRFMIGTGEGDIHSIGKNIVKTMLTAAGFEVIDLGVDIKAEKFVERARELEPDIIGLSALMTTTMVMQREVIKALIDAELRKRPKVIVGGAPVTQAWVDEIGADACGFDAGSAVQVALELMKEG